MKFLIDTQQDTLRTRMKTSELILGQLLTPLTGYSDWGGLYAIDNGAFSGFPAEKFERLLKRQEAAGQLRLQDCLFVTVPDIVGNARRTLELWNLRERWFSDRAPHWSNRLALVAQDGLEDLEIPWREVGAIFIGGGDPWKDSRASGDIVKTAKTLGVFVHVGRVNTPKRFDHFEQLGADTCDGSGVAMYDHMLEKIERRNDNPPSLFSENEAQ
jgi:hypothetical protein